MSHLTQKTDAMLLYIIKDAGEALRCAEQNEDQVAISKYADQVCDACTERYRRMNTSKRRRITDQISFS